MIPFDMIFQPDIFSSDSGRRVIPQWHIDKMNEALRCGLIVIEVYTNQHALSMRASKDRWEICGHFQKWVPYENATIDSIRDTARHAFTSLFTRLIDKRERSVFYYDVESPGEPDPAIQESIMKGYNDALTKDL